MIPRVTTGGRSFKGAFLYYLHDKKSNTSERVAWSHTNNMLTDDPNKAWKVMAYTAREQARLKEASGQSRAGRKLEKPVFSYSLSWHPEQTPTKEHMIETANRSIEMMGLSDHESVIIAHTDEDHPHVHVIVNRVHPITGMAGDVRNSKRKFSEFAHEYEREHGKIYCMQRQENQQKREQGKLARYHDPVIVQAWKISDSAQSFVAALRKEGYTLARGRKRLVVVDPHGKAHNPVRHLDGVRAKEFNARMSSLDLGRLPDADHIPALTDKDKLTKSFNQEAQVTEQKVSNKTEKQTGSSGSGDTPVKLDQNETARLEFEEQATERLNAQQSRHLGEDANLHDKYHYKLFTTKQQMAKYYQLRQQKKHIQELNQKCQNPSWWKRLTGKARRERQELRDSVRTYKNAHQRYSDHLEKVKIERNGALKKLHERHDFERNELRSYIDLQRKTGDYRMTNTQPKRLTIEQKRQQDQQYIQQLRKGGLCM